MTAWRLGQTGAFDQVRRYFDEMALWHQQRLNRSESNDEQQWAQIIQSDDYWKKLATRLPDENRSPKRNILSQGHTARLLIAALTVAGDDPVAQYRILTVLDGQFYALATVDYLYELALDVLTGEKPALERFTHSMNFAFLNCGFENEPGFGHGPVPFTPDDERLGLPHPDDIERGRIPRIPPRLGMGHCMAEGIPVLRGRAWRKYTIYDISPPRACPGETITITGLGFGDAGGKVRFSTETGAFSQVVPDPENWRDTQIIVSVPSDAVCGEIILDIPLPRILLPICGVVLKDPVSASRAFNFLGGLTYIKRFGISISSRSCRRATEEETVIWEVCNAETAQLQIREVGSGRVWLNEEVLPDDSPYQFTIPSVTPGTELILVFRISGPCGVDQARLSYRSGSTGHFTRALTCPQASLLG